jgi:uncharacterized protein (DUF1684 family)
MSKASRLLLSGRALAGLALVLSPGFGVLLVLGCGPGEWPSPPPVVAAGFEADHEAWRSARRDRQVTPPSGPVLWIGLWELPQGTTEFGSDPALPIVLNVEDALPLAGILRRSGQEVRLEPADRSGLKIGDGEFLTDPLVLGSDRSDKVTTLKLGSLGMRIHGEPGTDRLWLRVWDEDLPARETFELPEYFPIDPTWRVVARFEPYSEPRSLMLADVTSGMIEYQTPGDLVFRKDGREHRLIAVANPNSSSFLILLRDSTSATVTYPGGRYLRAPFADEEGWTTIDFNRTYNAPCVFTAFSVCAFPPRENWLELAVTAGEQAPGVLP